MSEGPGTLLRRAAWVARVAPWWLADKSPVSADLAEPLAAWLEATARAVDDAAAHCREHGEFMAADNEDEALAVARVLALPGVDATPQFVAEIDGDR